MTASSIHIQTGSRLHFGPLSYLPTHGRHFGGIGLMVEQPGFELKAGVISSAEEDRVDSPRAAELLRTLRQRNPEWRRLIEIQILNEVPSHFGLGSGTQLALAVAESVARLNETSPTIRELAEMTGRGERSAIGFYGYEQGGFLVDAGHPPNATLGDLACRVSFPEDWRLVIVLPPSQPGLSGSEERAAFAQLPPLSDSTTAELCRLTLMEILPALHCRDFAGFSEALFEYGRRVGEFFAPCQGGIFALPAMQCLAASLRSQGVRGIAQSSWGPAIVVMAEDEGHAADVTNRILAHESGRDCRLIQTRARNVGRRLLSESTRSPADHG